MNHGSFISVHRSAPSSAIPPSIISLCTNDSGARSFPQCSPGLPVAAATPLPHRRQHLSRRVLSPQSNRLHFVITSQFAALLLTVINGHLEEIAVVAPGSVKSSVINGNSFEGTWAVVSIGKNGAIRFGQLSGYRADNRSHHVPPQDPNASRWTTGQPDVVRSLQQRVRIGNGLSNFTLG